MKAKVLRKKKTKEFAHILSYYGRNYLCTSALPDLHPMTATMKLMKEYYGKGICDFDYDELELVKYDITESKSSKIKASSNT